MISKTQLSTGKDYVQVFIYIKFSHDDQHRHQLWGWGGCIPNTLPGVYPLRNHQYLF